MDDVATDAGGTTTAKSAKIGRRCDGRWRRDDNGSGGGEEDGGGLCAVGDGLMMAPDGGRDDGR